MTEGFWSKADSRVNHPVIVVHLTGLGNPEGLLQILRSMLGDPLSWQWGDPQGSVGAGVSRSLREGSWRGVFDESSAALFVHHSLGSGQVLLERLGAALGVQAPSLSKPRPVEWLPSTPAALLRLRPRRSGRELVGRKVAAWGSAPDASVREVLDAFQESLKEVGVEGDVLLPVAAGRRLTLAVSDPRSPGPLVDPVQALVAGGGMSIARWLPHQVVEPVTRLVTNRVCGVASLIHAPGTAELVGAESVSFLVPQVGNIPAGMGGIHDGSLWRLGLTLDVCVGVDPEDVLASITERLTA